MPRAKTARPGQARKRTMVQKKRTKQPKPAAKKATPKKAAKKRAPKRPNGTLYFMTPRIRDAAAKKLRSAGFKGLNRGADLTIPAGRPKYLVWSHDYSTGELARVLENPCKGKRNPETAAEMYELFHGKPPKRIKQVTEQEEYPVDVADCGKLLKLDVFINGEKRATELNTKGNTRVWVTPDGGQIYFHGGDQSLNLNALGIEAKLPKDHVEIGPVHMIHYLTSKDFHDFEPTHYYHKFGEARGGRLPTLNYDIRNRRLYLSGGTYLVKREGIVN